MKTNYYMHKKLNISDIGYGFFTKNWSLPIDNHTSLNCSHNTNDDQNVVNKNINIAKKKNLPIQIYRLELSSLLKVHKRQY